VNFDFKNILFLGGFFQKIDVKIAKNVDFISQKKLSFYNLQ
jgi:hypothetical protein